MGKPVKRGRYLAARNPQLDRPAHREGLKRFEVVGMVGAFMARGGKVRRVPPAKAR